MVVVNLSNLPEIREKHKNEKIVFCSGTFDLMHAGHILFFEDCKKLGDVVFVSIGDDKTTKKYKGENRPILNEHVRLKSVDSLKYVDYTMLDIPPKDGKYDESILSVLFPVFEFLKPDIWAMNDDAFDIKFRKEIAKKYNIKVEILQRTCPKEFENISTTKIIDKIRQG